MADLRPAELARYIESAAAKNDALILTALTKIEEQRQRGKLKPTVSTVCQLTGLSRNTVRNRSWALERLKLLKQKWHNGEEIIPTPTQTRSDDEEPIADKLRVRVRHLLEQNALFYEEILALRRTIKKKDEEIATLKRRTLRRV